MSDNLPGTAGNSKIIIGTRGSELALWQANFVKDELAKLGLDSELKIIKTQGDKTQGDFPEPDLAKPTVSFTPHLVPMTRGILATCTTRPEAGRLNGGLGLTDEGLLALYEDFYRGEPLVAVQADLPQTKAVYGSDRTLVSVRFDRRSGLVSAFAVTDNLGKGAAGGAVQAFNVAFGFEETLGLFMQGVWP